MDTVSTPLSHAAPPTLKLLEEGRKLITVPKIAVDIISRRLPYTCTQDEIAMIYGAILSDITRSCIKAQSMQVLLDRHLIFETSLPFTRLYGCYIFSQLLYTVHVLCQIFLSPILFFFFLYRNLTASLLGCIFTFILLIIHRYYTAPVTNVGINTVQPLAINLLTSVDPS